jgi:hypothetical protein
VKTKKIRFTIEDKYVDVTLDMEDIEIDDDYEDVNEDEMIASYAFIAAFVSGAIKVDIQDIETEENKGHCPEHGRLQ